MTGNYGERAGSGFNILLAACFEIEKTLSYMIYWSHEPDAALSQIIRVTDF